jgi:hypothetical protein
MKVPFEGWPLELEAVVRRSRAVAGQGGFKGIAYEAGLELTDVDEAQETAIKATLLHDGAAADQRGEEPGSDFSLVKAG